MLGEDLGRSGGKELKEEEDFGAHIVRFVDSLNEVPPSGPLAPISEDGGARFLLTSSPDGYTVRHISPLEDPQFPDELIVGSQVRYDGSPSSTLSVSRYIPNWTGWPARHDADYLTLLNGSNDEKVAIRMVTINNIDQDKLRERYVIISNNNKHTVYRDTTNFDLRDPFLIRDSVGPRLHVAILSQEEKKQAFTQIAECYKSTVGGIVNNHQVTFARRVGDLPK